MPQDGTSSWRWCWHGLVFCFLCLTLEELRNGAIARAVPLAGCDLSGIFTGGECVKLSVEVNLAFSGTWSDPLCQR